MAVIVKRVALHPFCSILLAKIAFFVNTNPRVIMFLKTG
ncbi:MAG: hypothetical protein PWQ18_667 [Clostridia bacterium]|nr:hypothetical protein [Clostridia bacterium]